MTLTIPNLGALKSIQNYFNATKYELTAQALYQLTLDVGVDCQIGLAAYYAFAFYIGDKDLTFSTIFTNNYANLTSDQANAVWNDSQYGWNDYHTLKYWSAIAWNDIQTKDPLWDLLKSKFGLTDQQMMAIVGTNSILNQLRLVFQSYVKDTLQCQNMPCKQDVLFAAQWSSAAISSLGLFNAPAIKTCAEFNQTYPGIPEISQFGSGLFDATTVAALFTYNTNLMAFSSNQSSLLNPATLAFIDAQRSNPSAIMNRLGFNSEDQATAIVKYLDSLFNSYTYVDTSLTQDVTTIKGITLFKKIFENSITQTSANILPTLIGVPTYNWISKNQSWGNCSAFYAGALGGPTNLSTCACSSLFPDPSTFEGQMWIVNGYLQVKANIQWPDQALFYDKCPQSIGDFMKLFRAPNNWTNYMTQVNSALTSSGALTCPYDCGLYQWATGGVTANLPAAYFPKNYTSLHEIYQKGAGYISEFYGYSKLQLNQTITLSPSQVKKLFFEFGVGTLTNVYEFTRLMAASLAHNDDYINKRFKSTGVTDFLDQFNEFIRYVLYTSYMPLTIQISAKDLLWGYTDSYVTNMAIGTPMQGFNKYLNPVIGFVGPQDNQADYGNNKSLLSTMNTGTTNYSKVRSYSTYRTASTVGVVLDQYFDGSTLYKNYQLNPWNVTQQINGTDGIAFQPPLKNQDLYYFSESLYRNFRLEFNETEYSGNYELANYRIADAELLNNTDYFTVNNGFVNLSFVKDGPFVASYPYYLDCDQSILQHLQVNGQNLTEAQKRANRTTFKLEHLTGYTVDKAEYIQYSVQAKSNSFWAELFSAPVVTLPILIEESRIKSPESRYPVDLDDAMSEMRRTDNFQMIAAILCGLFLVGALGCFVMYKKQSKEEKHDEESGYHAHVDSQNAIQTS
eukprot:CAMPEP_0176425674 /NCGR_PEP_ID=MMETSP0127-20121128/11516_1 /TAXON_ID=938130 /ORGANISM="Platyophrya macrostoma, Strain WH" /LENGTH=903 /DNA_ID=CAMNT_0017806853 /DNA_START=410 /DNA_END=3121 /DNA_ORIENTATION=+